MFVVMRLKTNENRIQSQVCLLGESTAYPVDDINRHGVKGEPAPESCSLYMPRHMHPTTHTGKYISF